jgi:hypothetical protein
MEAHQANGIREWPSEPRTILLRKVFFMWWEMKKK